MFTVTQLANRADVTADTVRHYAHISLLSPQRNPQNGYKLFNEGDIHSHGHDFDESRLERRFRVEKCYCERWQWGV